MRELVFFVLDMRELYEMTVGRLTPSGDNIPGIPLKDKMPVYGDGR